MPSEQRNLPRPDIGSDPDRIAQLLPASYTTDGVHLRASSLDVGECLRKELDLRKLNNLDNYLWLAGQFGLPRPLHQQYLQGREVCITEAMDMHLLWTSGKLFVKPCPRFLLDPQFWTRYLRCGPDVHCTIENGACRVHPELWKTALGFLFSYTGLIRYPSDFKIAKDLHLLPGEVEWLAWVHFVQQLNDRPDINSRINPRFCHGELRLNRLNTLHQLLRDHSHGYSTRWYQYSTFFSDNFAWLAGATVYIAIVLTAMQVGQATEQLGGNPAFLSATYGFAVFSILGPLLAGATVVVLFFAGIAYNFVNTEHRRARRLERVRCGHTHGTGFWKRQREKMLG